MIKTVLGDIKEDALGITLPHEHICCYSEYAYRMAGKDYLDKDALADTATVYLKELKKKYGLATFVDCTPINIGRDVELLKRISEQSEINIICSTGFYYTDEPVLYNTSAEQLCKYMVADAYAVNAGIIKCAVENEAITRFGEKLLRACAKAHLCLGLPIVLHSNANNRNALKALEILFLEGVNPNAVTVGHLSDTDDLEYVKNIASYGCFIGLDRLYKNTSEEYVSKKTQSILELCKASYEDQILLSHDALFFNGFEAELKIYEQPRFSYCFDYILPQLTKSLSDKLMVQNPMRMLSCK
jgi:phosphotriesterase-related protein